MPTGTQSHRSQSARLAGDCHRSVPYEIARSVRIPDVLRRKNGSTFHQQNVNCCFGWIYIDPAGWRASGNVRARSLCCGSVAGELVDHVLQGLAALVPRQVLEEKLHRPEVRVGVVVGAVGGEEHVLELPEGVVGREGLGLEDVEGGAAEAVVREDIDESRFV